MAEGGRVHPAVPAAVAVVASVLLVVAIAGTASDDDTDAGAPARTTPATIATTSSTTSTLPTTTTTTLPDPVPVETVLVDDLDVAAPAAYRVAYDLVENGLARQETWTVRRPYESRIVSTRDGEQISGTLSSLTQLWNYFADRNGWIGIQPERHRAPFDVRFESAVPFLESRGLVEAAGTATVAGRTCSVLRTGQPLSGGIIAPPTADESVEFCVDGDGLLLFERWTNDGDLVVSREATSVELEPPIADDDFEPDAIGQGAEDFEALFQTQAGPLSDQLAELLDFDVTPPEGWTADGGVQRLGSNASGGPGATELVLFFRRGADLVEVEEHFEDAPVAIGADEGVRIALDGWDEAWFVPGFRTNAIRLRLSETKYVEIAGPVTRDLLTFALAVERIDDPAG